MFVLGTAGHVDHGKSTLVHALTGIDPDRLREEKERGMTIDLGFAWHRLPNGQEISIVDVPGHERFIKNMLAGVGGIDLALLIVAADEGVMPQTREHLAILDLLRVSHGIVVITKRDLVDDEWLELVTADIQETIAPTTLANAPLIAVSATTGAGLQDLITEIEKQLSGQAERTNKGRPRLPIDRIFTISGFGTVVTGTLIDGTLQVGQEVEVLPNGTRTRLRGLQTHKTKVDQAQPGSRVAANVAGLATTDLRRGDILTTPGWLRPSDAIDVRLRLIDSLARPLKHNAAVTFHSYAAERSGRVRLLDATELAPGATGWAQIRLDEPIAAIKGDLFIIRTANETIGGGEIIETAARRHRRFNEKTLDRLKALEQGTPEEIVLETLRRIEPCDVNALLKATPLPADTTNDAIETLVERGDMRVLADRAVSGSAYVISLAGWHALRETVAGHLAAQHKQFPLRPGLAKEELRQRLGVSNRIFTDLVSDLTSEGDIAEHGAFIAAATFTPGLTPAQQKAADTYLTALRAEPFSPPTDEVIDPEVLAFLIESGTVVKAGKTLIFDAKAYNTMVDRIVAATRANGKITLAETRDLFGTSRRYAQGILEHLDERKITRRVGDDRVLRQAGS